MDIINSDHSNFQLKEKFAKKYFEDISESKDLLFRYGSLCKSRKMLSVAMRISTVSLFILGICTGSLTTPFMIGIATCLLYKVLSSYVNSQIEKITTQRRDITTAWTEKRVEFLTLQVELLRVLVKYTILTETLDSFLASNEKDISQLIKHEKNEIQDENSDLLHTLLGKARDEESPIISTDEITALKRSEKIKLLNQLSEELSKNNSSVLQSNITLVLNQLSNLLSAV